MRVGILSQKEKTEAQRMLSLEPGLARTREAEMFEAYHWILLDLTTMGRVRVEALILEARGPPI
jgi:hypothetical protein